MIENSEDLPLKQVWSDLGASAMRHCAMQAGEIVLAVWDRMLSRTIAFDGTYDWDFVPAVLNRLDWPRLTRHNQYGGAVYAPDPDAILADMMAQVPEQFETPQQRWLAEERHAAGQIWAYPDLVEDHDERIDLDEPPAEWSRRIGDQYDLTPAAKHAFL
ncbi:hypothetical protein [Ensifer soli]|uniref:hypothetical protein n=1 Tax=Ciceribacter sp. sgz301302 TaxID=3342379 RepID=UPI0035B96FE1